MGNKESNVKLIATWADQCFYENQNAKNSNPAYLMIRAYGLFKKSKTLLCHTDEIHMMHHEYYAKVIFPRFFSKILQEEVGQYYKELQYLAKEPQSLISVIESNNGKYFVF